jgi:hypothetical protein
LVSSFHSEFFRENFQTFFHWCVEVVLLYHFVCGPELYFYDVYQFVYSLGLAVRALPFFLGFAGRLSLLLIRRR